MKEEQPQPSAQQIQRQKPHIPIRRMKLREWRNGGRAPWDMARGGAVVDGNVAYFMNCDG